VGGGLSKVDGNRHAFSLDDPSISYPYRLKDTVSVGVLLIVSIVAPAVIIGAISLIFVPGPTAVRGTQPSLIWRRKLWECHTGWMGLGVALAGAFMVTEGLKDIYGKPRPDLLNRCQPNLAKLAQFVVGGLGQQLGEAPLLVDSRICQQTDNSILRDGFASFPSGHASFSWAGMTYLTLFLCAKFAITIPFLTSAADNLLDTAAFDKAPSTRRNGMGAEIAPARNRAAAPPLYLLVLAFVPLGAAFYISGSRWSDYRHHGFDIIFGSILGFLFAWLGFRLYHLPIRRGAGWSWGARTRNRAFYIGMGIPSYIGDEGWESAKAAGSGRPDLESGEAITGPGMSDLSDASMINDRTHNIGMASGPVHSNPATTEARVLENV
jgi:membrane-associated phospholipid phosphatase